MHHALARSLTIATVAIATGAPALATNRYVAPCGNDAWTGVNPGCVAPTGPKRTIQAAINSALGGDTIFVLPGVYDGAIDLNGKAVTIVSTSGAAATFLERATFGSIVTCNSGEGPDTILEGFTLRDGFTLGRGGALFCGFSSPTVIDCVFDSNESQDEGGAVAAIAASPTFIDCAFADNMANLVQAEPGGGAIYGELATIELIDCTFAGNGAGGAGGAVALIGGSHATLDGCTFEENSLWFYTLAARGGAISVDDSELELGGCDFVENFSWGSGGAISIEYGTMTAVACTFDGNEADLDHAGAIRAVESELSIVGCGFTANRSNHYGAAITATFCDVSIGFSGFHHNGDIDGTGTTRGGAIWTSYSDMAVSACSFTNNASVDDGGAITIAGWTTNDDVVVTGSTFSQNTTGADGGAISVANGAATITGCTFSGNEAQFGGAVRVSAWAYEPTPDEIMTVLTDCTFEANLAFGGAGLYGNATTHVADCAFVGNVAEYVGGGLSLYLPGRHRVVNCLVEGNVAVSGAGASVGSHDTIVRKTTFRENSAETGAGLIATVTTTKPRIEACLFRNNTTTDGTAAIGVGSAAALVVVNSVIAWNSTIADGGAVHVFSGSLELKNSTVANNVGGGIVGGEYASQVLVDNTIVWGNSSGPQAGGTALTLRYSNVQGGMAGIGNMNANPKFIGALGVNYRLQPDSPCIDAGNNWLVGTDVGDLDGDGSTAELVPLDFDGLPRLADAVAPDAGCGADAIIDLGPFEVAGTAVNDVLFADLDGDGTIGGSDLGILLASFGAFGCNLADISGDGQVDGADLGLLLGAWTG